MEEEGTTVACLVLMVGCNGNVRVVVLLGFVSFFVFLIERR